MLTTVVLSLAVCCAPAAESAPAAPTRPVVQRTVSCSEVIDTVPFPFVGRRPYVYRPVLGAASLPPAYLPQSRRTGSPPWTHFSKSGLVVRAGEGEAVTVEIPPAWRTRVAISWGNAQHDVFSSLRFPRCGTDRSRGNAYAGGFLLRRADDCVPLRVRVGARSRVVWFGIGRRCG